MSWWFHLLVRKCSSLRDRVIVCERVMRAVGSFQYAQRAPPLLVALLDQYLGGDRAVERTWVIYGTESGRDSHHICSSGRVLVYRVAAAPLFAQRKFRGGAYYLENR